MLAPSWSDLPMFLEPAHQALGQEVASKLATKAGTWLSDPKTVAARLGELGLLGLLIPPALGGTIVADPSVDAKVDVRALCIVREALAYTSPLADAVFAVQGLGAYPMVVSRGVEARAPLLKDAMRGARVLGFALTEPEAGSDVAAMKSTARHEDGAWLLDGEKIFISNVGIAHHYVVFAHAPPRSTPPVNIRATALETPRAKRSISAFLVPSDAPGLTLEPIRTSGDHPLGRLVMRDCKVADDALVGDIGAGMSLALGTLEVFRTTVGAAAVGMARRAIDDTVARVKARVQFGKRLAEMQLTQAALAEMLTELDAARLLVFRAAFRKDKGEKARAEIAMAKLFATEAAFRIIDRAVQLHGGLGVIAGTPVEHLYREVRPLRIYEGTSEIQKLIIGSSLIDEPPETTSGRRV